MRRNRALNYLLGVSRRFGVPLHEVLRWPTEELDLLWCYDSVNPPFEPWDAFAFVGARLDNGLGLKTKPEELNPVRMVEEDEKTDVEKLSRIFAMGRKRG